MVACPESEYDAGKPGYWKIGLIATEVFTWTNSSIRAGVLHCELASEQVIAAPLEQEQEVATVAFRPETSCAS
jgi:hypothetical protein